MVDMERQDEVQNKDHYDDDVADGELHEGAKNSGRC